MPLDNLDPTPGGDKWNTEGYPKLNAAIDKINDIDVNLPGGTTDQVLKKTDGTDYNYEWTNSVLPGTGVSGNIKIKKIAIGNWDMDATGNPDVAPVHGVTADKIIDVTAMIVSDTGTAPYISLTRANGTSDGTVGGGISINATNLTLFRITGGIFDSTSYNNPSFNRGYVFITYEE